jgi:Ca2+-transporting ATPase
MTKGPLTTAGLVGLFMAVCTLALISYGTNHFDSLAVGPSMGLTAFSLFIIVAAFQARSVTTTALRPSTIGT